MKSLLTNKTIQVTSLICVIIGVLLTYMYLAYGQLVPMLGLIITTSWWTYLLYYHSQKLRMQKKI